MVSKKHMINHIPKMSKRSQHVHCLFKSRQAAYSH
uniref:Uncharacterized protein n=1 Tax=Arundo donax TaxID=35708 RepID=A0A0A8ZWM5_ARUDO